MLCELLCLSWAVIKGFPFYLCQEGFSCQGAPNGPSTELNVLCGCQGSEAPAPPSLGPDKRWNKALLCSRVWEEET